MRTLIAGIGALGGTLAARALAAGMPVQLAARNEEQARRLRETGVRVSGVGGPAFAAAPPVSALADVRDRFELIVLATKAHDALEIAPRLASLLQPGGVLLPIQNGGVSQLLGESAGACVIGGLSNLGATMHEPGVYEQRNAGHLLIGELSGGDSERAQRVARFLGRALETRVTANLRGAIWSKLLLNCSVTTLGAVAGQPMRQYIAYARELFRRTYDETLAVARAQRVEPIRMIVDPVPSADYDLWLGEILAAYGDLKPSMLQDFERGRRTEIDFINGYVAKLGPAPLNAAITQTVHAIERGETTPHPDRLRELSALA